MIAELDHVEEARARWGFSVGCLWAATRMRIGSREGGGALLRITVLGGVVVSLALVAYGLMAYPGLRSTANFWGAIAVFGVTLVCYAALTFSLSRGRTRRSSGARRYGLIGGVAVGASWFVAIAPPSAVKGWVFLPLLVAFFGPALVAAVAGRRTRDSGMGTLAALWTGIVGGLTVFIVWVIATYMNADGPYDTGLVRDFHTSGAHDLTTYAVSDNLGSGLVLLLMIPTVALAFGSLAARLAAATRRT